ncbi:unnamed protein product, partial [Laminaria digitata]
AVVVLGERGSNSVLKIYVEEVPEEEGEGEPSLAVQVAEDQPNRIMLNLTLTEGLEGPAKISADKRWTSDQLRDAVASALGCGNRAFRLRKCQGNTLQIRPGPETLRNIGFYDSITLHVSPGRPLELHEEAITVAPLIAGFRVGLVPAPPLSVLLALAGGRSPGVGRVGPTAEAAAVVAA